MKNNIKENFFEINDIFNSQYANKGFLFETYHVAVSFFKTGACW
ncbi:MAG: hypothetical protein PHX04_01915 [Bacilli bacterium]|nr:hypothetical protein [Bacilli bacterium]